MKLNVNKSPAILSILLVCSIYVQAQESAGWTNLFDGKTLKGWKKVAGTADYKVEDGAIVGITLDTHANTFLVADKAYGDFILEMEVMLQDSTLNSGVQFRSEYDPTGFEGKGKVYGYQFELDPSSRKWYGGIYDEARRGWLYPLTLNPPAQEAFKAGVYNKIRIEAIGNTIQTFVNGKAAACLVDVMTLKGLIALQVHAIEGDRDIPGKKIYWKNIRIKTEKISHSALPPDMYIVNTIPNSLTSIESRNGWRLLFDGKTSSGWKGAYRKDFPEKGWQIKDGLLTVLPSSGSESANGGDIVTLQQFHAFDLSFAFRLTPGANSGVKYFVTLKENNPGSAIGLEYQVLDDKLHPDAKLGRNGNRTLSSLYDLIPANKEGRFVAPIGEWNYARVIVYPNNHVEHYLNGVKVLEYQRGSAEFRELVAISKFKVWEKFGEAPEGHILIQDHGNEVSYRSIKIKELH